MSQSQLPTIILSFHDGWHEPIGLHPSLFRMSALPVLPLSMLPPGLDKTLLASRSLHPRRSSNFFDPS
jgi:hypothetical protein